MPRHKLINTFSDFVNNYDFENPMITLKYTHSLNVAAFCFDIAQTLALDQKESIFAFTLGLVHDIGAFGAWQQRNAFVDIPASIKLLLKNNLSQKFGIDKSNNKTLEFTLLLHDNFKMGFEKLQKYLSTLKNKDKKEKEILMYYHILNDADVLDLFGMLKRKSLPLIVIPSFKKTSLSKDVLNTFKQEQVVDRAIVKSKLDEIVMILSLFYQLKFNYSKKQALKFDFAEAVFDYFSPELTQEEKQKLEKVIKTFKAKFADSF
jgi:hypothetical protein